MHFVCTSRAIKHLNREAEIHRQLRNANIVSMLGVVFEDGNYGLVLEYVQYGALDKFMNSIKEITGWDC